MGAFKQLGQ